MKDCELNKEELVAMAVAVVAEDMDIKPERLRVLSFREVQESSLKRYLKDQGIDHVKYRMEVDEDA